MKVKETKTPYEALIDNFEPKMSAETVTQTFEQLLDGLKPLIAKIESCQRELPAKTLNLDVPIEEQRKRTQLITQNLGFDTASPVAGGRVDETEHPFTSGFYDDVRITTHYYLNNFVSAMFSVLHESGHAIYEQNLNPEWKYHPVGATCSYGIHESQSRFFENIIGHPKSSGLTFCQRLASFPNLSSLKLTLSCVL